MSKRQLFMSTCILKISFNFRQYNTTKSEIICNTNQHTHTGEVVRRTFGEHHNNALKFTDSQILLHWISNKSKPMKQ